MLPELNLNTRPKGQPSVRPEKGKEGPNVKAKTSLVQVVTTTVEQVVTTTVVQVVTTTVEQVVTTTVVQVVTTTVVQVLPTTVVQVPTCTTVVQVLLQEALLNARHSCQRSLAPSFLRARAHFPLCLATCGRALWRTRAH